MRDKQDIWTEDEAEWEKINIVEDEKMVLLNQCEILKQEGEDESYNGDNTKALNYMGAVDNAMVTEGVEEGSLSYYSVILGSYEDLS